MSSLFSPLASLFQRFNGSPAQLQTATDPTRGQTFPFVAPLERLLGINQAPVDTSWHDLMVRQAQAGHAQEQDAAQPKSVLALKKSK